MCKRVEAAARCCKKSILLIVHKVTVNFAKRLTVAYYLEAG